MKVYEACGSSRVSIPDLIKKAREMGQGSEEIIRKLVRESTTLEADISGKTYYVSLKESSVCHNEEERTILSTK